MCTLHEPPARAAAAMLVVHAANAADTLPCEHVIVRVCLYAASITSLPPPRHLLHWRRLLWRLAGVQAGQQPPGPLHAHQPRSLGLTMKEFMIALERHAPGLGSR